MEPLELITVKEIKTSILAKYSGMCDLDIDVEAHRESCQAQLTADQIVLDKRDAEWRAMIKSPEMREKIALEMQQHDDCCTAWNDIAEYEQENWLDLADQIVKLILGESNKPKGEG